MALSFKFIVSWFTQLDEEMTNLINENKNWYFKSSAENFIIKICLLLRPFSWVITGNYVEYYV